MWIQDLVKLSLWLDFWRTERCDGTRQDSLLAGSCMETHQNSEQLTWSLGILTTQELIPLVLVALQKTRNFHLNAQST